MSYAISTQKRKFNRIFDAIANASNTSLNLPTGSSTPQLPSDYESPANKKARLTPSDTASVASRRWSAQSRGMPGKAPVTPRSDREKPHFQPWDRKDFLERLETFSVMPNWINKPAALTGEHWSKRGWKCVGENTVGCAGCSAEVTVEVNQTELYSMDDAAAKQRVEQFVDKIVTGHKEGCLWRVKACDVSIQRLPLAHPMIALEALRQRYDSLVKVASDLPSTLKTPEAFDLEKLSTQFSTLVRILNKTPAPTHGSQSSSPEALRAMTECTSSAKVATLKHFPEIPPAEEYKSKEYYSINAQALNLAFFGWQARLDSYNVGVVTCKACFQRHGLWSYRRLEEESEVDRHSLDVDNHRRYCPWINARTQSAARLSTSGSEAETELTAGWQDLVKAIETAYENKIARARDSLQQSLDAMTPAESSRPGDDIGVANEVASVMSVGVGDDGAEEERKDKERWARFKKLKRVFTVKKSKVNGKENLNLKRTKSVV